MTLLKPLVIVAGYASACKGHTTELVCGRICTKQGGFPCDPGGYGGSQGDEDGDRGTGHNRHVDFYKDAPLTNQPDCALTHTNLFNKDGEEESAAVEEAGHSQGRLGRLLPR